MRRPYCGHVLCHAPISSVTGMLQTEGAYRDASGSSASSRRGECACIMKWKVVADCSRTPNPKLRAKSERPLALKPQ